MKSPAESQWDSRWEGPSGFGTKKSRGMVILRFVCCLRNHGLHGAMVDRAGEVA